MGKSKKTKSVPVSPTEEGRKMREAVLKVFRARLDSPSKGGALLLGPALSHHGSEATSSQRSNLTCDAASGKSKNSLELAVTVSSSDSGQNMSDTNDKRAQVAPKIRRRKTRQERNTGRKKTKSSASSTKERNDFIKQLRKAEDMTTHGRVSMTREPIMFKLGNNRLTKKLGVFNRGLKSSTITREADSSSALSHGEESGSLLKRLATYRKSPEQTPLHDTTNTTTNRTRLGLQTRSSKAANQRAVCAPSPMDVENATPATHHDRFPESPDMAEIAKLLISSCNVSKHFPGRELRQNTKKELCRLLESNFKSFEHVLTPHDAHSSMTSHQSSSHVTSSAHVTPASHVTPLTRRVTPASSSYPVPKNLAHLPPPNKLSHPDSATLRIPAMSLSGGVRSKTVFRRDLTNEIANETNDTHSMDTSDTQAPVTNKLLPVDIDDERDASFGDADTCVMSPKSLFAINEKRAAAKERQESKQRLSAAQTLSSNHQPCFPSHHPQHHTHHQRNNTHPPYIIPVSGAANHGNVYMQHNAVPPTKNTNEALLRAQQEQQIQYGLGLPARLSGRQYVLGSDGRLHLPVSNDYARQQVLVTPGLHVPGGNIGGLAPMGTSTDVFMHQYGNVKGNQPAAAAQSKVAVEYLQQRPSYIPASIGHHGDGARSRTTQEINTNMDILDYLDFGLRNEPMGDAAARPSSRAMSSSETDQYKRHQLMTSTSSSTHPEVTSQLGRERYRLHQETFSGSKGDGPSRDLDWIDGSRAQGRDSSPGGIQMRPQRLF